MSRRVALLVVGLPCLLAASLSAPPLASSLRRIRGGDLDDIDFDEEEEEAVPAAATSSSGTGDVPAARALSRDEIMEKLNVVPVFCILNSEGGVVGMRAADGGNKPAVCWFTDALEARALLEQASKANPEAGLHLACHGMGAVFTQCKGWTDDVEVDDVPLMKPASVGGETVELKLRGTYKLVEELAPRLQELLAAGGIDAGCWQLPIFMCKEMQSASIVPVFLHPADLAATWKSAGGNEEDIPENLAVMDLRMLVKEMQTDASPWQLIHFVVSPESVKLAEELQKDKETAAST